MGISTLLKFFGLDIQPLPRQANSSAGMALLGQVTSNPLPNHRAIIILQQESLTSVAVSGNHEKLNDALTKFSSEILLYNGNLSRLVVNKVMEKFGKTSDQYIEVKKLYALQIAAYRNVRALCQKLIEDAPLKASDIKADDFTKVGVSQSKRVQTSLVRIGSEFASLKKVWADINKYEELIFETDKV